MQFNDLYTTPPFASPDEQKGPLLKELMREALDHHLASCDPFKTFCDKKGWGVPPRNFDFADIPYLPAELFRRMSLKSVDDSKIVRALRSSSTSSQTPSTVFIDEVTRQRQTKTLLWLLGERLGHNRRPFVIMDADPSLTSSGERSISARTAALRGFLIAASSADYCMALDREGRLIVDLDKLAKTLLASESVESAIVLFGYTYVLYADVIQPLLKSGVKFSLPEATILHIGGWKKLQSEAVSKQEFNSALQQVFGIPPANIIDVYGFTEQLGLVYTDCVDGIKRCPVLSEIIVRDPQTLEPVPDGTAGLMEFITPMPYSYPGIALLLDDIGRVVTRDQCACGRQGTAFEIIGRAQEDQVRGCGDVMAEQVLRTI